MSPTSDQTGGGEDNCVLLPVDDVVQSHPHVQIDPASVAFSPDDKLISYRCRLDSKLGTGIYAFDPALLHKRLLVTRPDGEEGTLSSAEKLFQEKFEKRGGGAARYQWAKGATGPKLMVEYPGGIYVQDGPKELRLRVPSTASSPLMDPKFAPDGCSIAFVRDDEIFIIPTTEGEEMQITSGARESAKMHGIAGTIAPEDEMEKRPGFWWSLDSRLIAFAEVDAIPFLETKLVESVGGGDTEEDHESSVVGKANVNVRLGIVPAAGGDTSWLQLHNGETEQDDGEDLIGVKWLPDGCLVAQVQNHAQAKLRLLKFDPSTGQREILLTEETSALVKLHECFAPLSNGTGGFIWASERSGFRQLYLYDAGGECLGPLTAGNCAVEQIAGVDENAGVVYFTGSVSPLETHLYCTHLFPDFTILVQSPKKLTEGEGRHIVVIDHQMKRFVDIHDSMETPPQVSLCSLDSGGLLASIYERLFQTPEAENLLVSPQNEICNLPLPAKSGELATGDDDDTQRVAAMWSRLASRLLEGLCGQCTVLVQQRLSSLSAAHAPADFDSSSSLPGEFSTSASEVTKTVLSSSVCCRDDTASSADSIIINNQPQTVERHEKPRPWSEELSSSSDVDEEVLPPPENYQACEAASSPTSVEVAPLGKIRVPATERQGDSDLRRTLSFHSEKLQFAWANATLPSPRPVGHEEPVSRTPERSEEGTHFHSGPPSPSPKGGLKLPREQMEARRLHLVERKKDFSYTERIRGRSVNVVEGLELHKKVFNKLEQERLIDLVYEYQQKGRDGLLRDRTYSEPRKWMPGKGRVTIQFGCCYNYAVDSNGNPPGIMHTELVDPLPNLLKVTIRRLIKWRVLPETCVPDSCIINIYDVGDCIPPHIDHHDFVRPFCTLSLLSECNILFGSRLKIVGDGLFDGPLSIPLPVGSVLVLQGNGADVAKHAVPGVPTRRISITFRKMDPLRVPQGYALPKDLRGVKALPDTLLSCTQ